MRGEERRGEERRGEETSGEERRGEERRGEERRGDERRGEERRGEERRGEESAFCWLRASCYCAEESGAPCLGSAWFSLARGAARRRRERVRSGIANYNNKRYNIIAVSNNSGGRRGAAHHMQMHHGPGLGQFAAASAGLVACRD